MKKIILYFIIVSLFFACGKDKKATPVVISPPPVPTTPVWDVNAIRGTWITSVASTVLDSRANIKTAMQTCKAAGINHVFVVVYNNSRTMFVSEVMNALISKPIQESYQGRDPLQECIEEGHALGLKVHAWFEYGFASSYLNNGGPIIATKPNWAAKDVGGNNVVKNDFYWLNGLHPEVQQFMIDLFKEVVTKYDVDGVQGDDRLPAMPTTGGYDIYTKNLYAAENGGVQPPATFSDASWVQWRAKKLNLFLKRLRSEVKAIKPNMQLTLSPSPYPWGLTEYLQDWPTWVDSAWCDAVIPQCYRYDITGYSNTIDQQKTYYRNQNIPMYPGIIVRTGGSQAVAESLLTQEIQKNRAAGLKGEVFFYYEGVKDRLTWHQNIYPFTK